MKARRVNLEYLNLYQEIPLFCVLALRNLFRKKPQGRTSRVLIVNTCLIGEFAASLPAIRDFIQRNPQDAVDLVVAPPLKELAERVRGVKNVYTAKSVYGRGTEKVQSSVQEFGAYDAIFVMRMSAEVYRLLRTIPAASLHSGLKEYSKYALHLGESLLLRRRPKQWVELNFEMLGGTFRRVPFDEIFECTPNDYASVAKLDVLQTVEKKVIIHTGASWPMKHWDTGKWAALFSKAQGLGAMRFIFVGGKEDEADYKAIASQLNFPVYSLIGQVTLPQLLLVMRRSEYFIGVDSGPKSMAYLADLRSVSIFGPGPHFYLPLDPRDIAIDKTRGGGVWQMFFYTRKGFIHQITVDEVYDAFKKIWNS